MKIAVIGAGLLGVSTAYFLQQSGHAVTLIDRQNGPGLETSFANGGMITPSQSAPWNSPGLIKSFLKLIGDKRGPLIIQPSALLASLPWCLKFLKNSSLECFVKNQKKNYILADYSLKEIKKLRKELSLNYEAKTRGTLKVFRSVQEMNDAKTLFELLDAPAKVIESVDRDRILEIEPALVSVIEKLCGGIYYPDDESGDAYKFCQEITTHLKKNVTCLFDTTIFKLVCKKNHIVSMETSRGNVIADLYVLTAGTFSKILANPAGVTIPLEPVKGYSATIQATTSNSLPEVPVIDESRHIAITPYSERFRVAGMAELAGINTRIPGKRIAILIDFFREFYPNLADNITTSHVQPWCGLRPYSCDGVPIIGGCNINNLYLNTGHGHLGWTMAVGSAKLLSDHISQKITEIDLSPYLIYRFNAQ